MVRPLHYVLKTTDRAASVQFLKDVLLMKVLRHEEFSEGCQATCNGPFQGRWSKTMIGYGAEDEHFVLELVYNYGIESYSTGNDLQKITIRSSPVKERIVEKDIAFVTMHDGAILVTSPVNPETKFEVHDGSIPDPIQKVTLSSSNLQRTKTFWHGALKMNIVEDKEHYVIFDYPEAAKFQLEFVLLPSSVEYGSSQGRTAFSCLTEQLRDIQRTTVVHGFKIKTPLVNLDTPDKASVQVVILLDPDGHEICFVADEDFRKLSTFDPEAENSLQQALDEHKTRLGKAIH
ncbi:glyoxalase domain-containing protein 4-like [Paramacrobiotus metropolitanus]|uniref:glyoxalase domain-containing protein 4-like n=1 Tax=Paramacrobiotus metropolitanus TaxID=2943436 RepID=UPI0024465A3E|nr:glyoxalase domain-containing protein 4-like [Paramacrobiotus metropolitanus]XP_055332830.1 glyoxalase domain-containing protein 4-like [Paramacrobiotus metropolitanus]